jgi:hypothetical protein
MAIGSSDSWTIPKVSVIEARAAVSDSNLRPEIAFASQLPIDLNKDFFPFGTRPALNETFYLGSDEAFGARGATVTLDVTLTNPDMADGTPKPAAPSKDLTLRWEYWNAAVERWEELASSGPGTASSVRLLTDGTAAFTKNGAVTFTRPDTMGRVAVNGELRHWIRARIARGNYGVEAHYEPVRNTDGTTSYVVVLDSFRPPSIRSVIIGYTYATAIAPLDAVVAENAFAFTDYTGAAAHAGGGGEFTPFAPGEDADSALYLGFDGALPDAPLSLYLGVAEARYRPSSRDGEEGEPPALVWEYWSVWGAQTRFHAARLYSWTSPPRRSRRSTAAVGGRTTRRLRAGGSGGARFSERCGLWLL